MQCETCRYYRRRKELNGDIGECLFNPPALVVTQAGPESFYPVVAADAFCSRHEKGDVAVPAKIAKRMGGQTVSPHLVGR